MGAGLNRAESCRIVQKSLLHRELLYSFSEPTDQELEINYKVEQHECS